MSDKQPIGRVMLNNVRLSFPALFKPEAFQPGDPEKYKATFLIPKGSPLVKKVEAAILAVLAEKHNGDTAKAAKTLAGIKGNRNKCAWQDGDTYEYDGYADMMALTAKSTTRPTVIDGARQPLTAEDGKPYAGCYVNASVDVYAYDNKGLGVSASLRGVQFVRDGDAFAAGRPADSSEFEEISEGENAEDFA